MPYKMTPLEQKEWEKLISYFDDLEDFYWGVKIPGLRKDEYQYLPRFNTLWMTHTFDEDNIDMCETVSKLDLPLICKRDIMSAEVCWDSR
jgi:hypothetical protein